MEGEEKKIVQIENFIDLLRIRGIERMLNA